MYRGRQRREETIHAIQQQLQARPWDVRAWDDLIREYQGNNGSIEEKRTVYEQVLARFPKAAHYWRQYAEAEMASNNDANVRAIFSRCLLDCLDIDLYQSYIRFIRKVNDEAAGAAEVRQAYEFALDKLGQDVYSGGLWIDYLTFLQAPKPGTPTYSALYAVSAAGQEESHRLALIRSVFQRAVVVPTVQLEQLWRQYENFEMSSTGNKAFARKILDEQKPRYSAARNALHQRRKLMDAIDRRSLAIPLDACGPSMRQLAGLWREYIAFERSNPQRLLHHDEPLLQARISLAYEQALMYLLYFPEAWHEFANYLLNSTPTGAQAALKVLDRGRKVLPEAVSLTFAASDLWESLGQAAEAEKVYESLLPPPKTAEAVEDGIGRVTIPAQLQALVWIQYMRFAKRTEGKDKARKVFLRARKSDSLTWEVVAASALMEWTLASGQGTVARNIFEQVGMAKFADNADFVIAYVSFLLGQGDVANARAVFERSLTAATDGQVNGTATADMAAQVGEQQKASRQKLWDAYVAFEHEHGEWSRWQDVERRRAQALGPTLAPGDAAKLAAQKYKCFDLMPYNQLQLQHIQRIGMPEPAPERLPAAEPASQAGPGPSPRRGAMGGPAGPESAPPGPALDRAPMGGPAPGPGPGPVPGPAPVERPGWQEGPPRSPGGFYGGPPGPGPRRGPTPDEPVPMRDPHMGRPPFDGPPLFEGPSLYDGPALPPALAALQRDLPPAHVWDGPIEDADLVIDAVMAWDGVDRWSEGPGGPGGPSGGAGAPPFVHDVRNDPRHDPRGAHPRMMPEDIRPPVHAGYNVSLDDGGYRGRKRRHMG